VFERTDRTPGVTIPRNEPRPRHPVTLRIIREKDPDSKEWKRLDKLNAPDSAATDAPK